LLFWADFGGSDRQHTAFKSPASEDTGAATAKITTEIAIRVMDLIIKNYQDD